MSKQVVGKKNPAQVRVIEGKKNIDGAVFYQD